MFLLHAEGFGYAEIAEMLTDAGIPTTDHQVGKKMSRTRAAIKDAAA